MQIKKADISTREARTLFFQDGALDLIAGATLLNFGFDVLSQSASSSLFTWVPILLFSSLKNRNTLPRLTPYLKNASDKQLRPWTIIPSFGLALMLVLLGVTMLSDAFSLASLRFPLGFVIIALLSLVPAFWIGHRQFFIYAAVAAAAGLLTFFTGMPALFIFITAAVMLFFGGRAMMRFSREFVIEEEKNKK